MEFGMFLTKVLALVTLVGNVFIVSLVALRFLARPIFEAIMNFLGKYAEAVGFFLTSASTLGSLLYSEVVGFPACILCWIQRIFMYPQMLLFGLALWRKEKVIIPYTFLLSILGGAVALYQWIKDMLLAYTHTTLPCPAVTGLPSCDRLYINEFGYITIPMLALNAFVLIGITMWASLRRKEEIKNV